MKPLSIKEISQLDLRKRYKIIGEHKFFTTSDIFIMLYYKKEDIDFLVRSAKSYLGPDAEKNKYNVLDKLISKMIFDDGKTHMTLVETKEDQNYFNNQRMLKAIEDDSPNQLGNRIMKQFMDYHYK